MRGAEIYRETERNRQREEDREGQKGTEDSARKSDREKHS